MRRLIAIFVLASSFACLARADDKPVDADEIVRFGKVRPGGAIVCRNLAMVAFMKQRMDGSSLPDFTATGCRKLPEGTQLTIESGSRGQTISSETLFGEKVWGVTDPTMIEVDP
jgi:hypothetical protein